MAMPILLIRLEGPLQSWGLRSRWSRRDTVSEPTKSAVIGLLGCAKGVIRPNWHSSDNPDKTLEQWDKQLIFGVRVDHPGIIETDYHTVQGHLLQANGKIKTAKGVNKGLIQAYNEPPHTEQTWRDYLHDASFLVALAIKPECVDANAGLLEELKGYLEKPKWPIYLGRKSCVPSRPPLGKLKLADSETEICPLTDQFSSIEEAFCSVDVSERRSFRFKKPDKLTAWIEDTEGSFERQDAMRINQLRFYDFRRCRRIEIDTKSNPWRVVE